MLGGTAERAYLAPAAPPEHRHHDAMIGPIALRRSLDPHKTSLRINNQLIAGANKLGDVAIFEAITHRELRQGRTLSQDCVGTIEQDRFWRDAARLHLMQHPRGRNTALGGVQHKYLIHIRKPKELMCWP